MEDNEQVNSDVSTEVSSEPQPAPVENTAPATDGPAQETKTTDEKPTPFHEHPRWKEMVEERNKERERASTLERSLHDLKSNFERQAQASKGPSERDELFKRLKDIDPAFGGLMEEWASKMGKVDNLEQTYNQERATTTQERYASNLNQLHSEFKVPKELQTVYDSQIRAIAMSNPRLGLNDLPSVYKQVHDQLNGAIEARIRAATSSYINAKKNDAAVPAAQGKAKAPTQGKATKQSDYPKDPYEARQLVVKRVIEQAAKDRSRE